MLIQGLYAEFMVVYRGGIRKQRARVSWDGFLGKAPASKPDVLNLIPDPTLFPWGQEEVTESPTAGLTAGCKPFSRCWEPNPGLLQEQQMLVSTEPSPQAPKSNIVGKNGILTQSYLWSEGKKIFSNMILNLYISLYAGCLPQKACWSGGCLSHYGGLPHTKLAFAFW